MNIFNTQQLQVGAKGGILGDGTAVGGLENQINLSPEALKLLEQSSAENGVNFDQVLKATKEGQDPEAVIELLKNEKNNLVKTPVQEVGPNLKKNNLSTKSKELNELLGNTNPEQITTKQPVATAEATEVVKNERAAFFPNQLKGKQALQISNPEQAAQKVVVQEGPVAKMNNVVSNTLVEEQMKQPLKQAVQNNPYQVQSGQSMVGNKEVAANSTKKSNLLSLNDFMAKQSPSLKNNAAKKAYKPISESMFNKKVDASLPGVVKAPQQETSLQDVILGKMDTSVDVGSNATETHVAQPITAKAETASTAGKVFDINSLSKLDTTADVISKVQDYIMQSKVSNQSQVEMSFDHKELGKVDLLVQKGAGDQLNISIGTNSMEAARFFNKNQADLLGTLAQSGIQVGEFKLDSSQTSNNQSNSQDSSKQQFGQNSKGQHQSESGQRDQESRKREGLWNQFYDKEVA